MVEMEQRSPEWFEARKGRVTASLVGAILGLSPYMSRNDAMRSMVREALGAEREFKGNVATEYGTFHEEGALIDFQMETGLTTQSVGFVTIEDWAGCSPDALIAETAGVEIKCPYSLRSAEAPVAFKTLAEQPHYEAQVQFTLWVTQRQFWHFYQWCPAGTSDKIVLPCAEWQNENLPKLRQFHAEFLHELKENPDEYLQPKRAEIDTPEASRMVKEWDDIAEQMALLAERKRDLLEDMVALAGEKNAIIAGRKLTLTEREGAISYAKVVKEHLPKLDISKYRGKASSFWQLR